MFSTLGLEIPGILVLVIALIIIWVIASIPVCIAGKLVTVGKASFGDAMAATLGGLLVYAIVVFGVTFFLGAVLGASAYVWAVILGFLAFLAVYRASFDTSWLGAIGIAIVGILVTAVLNAFLLPTFGVAFPSTLPHSIGL